MIYLMLTSTNNEHRMKNRDKVYHLVYKIYVNDGYISSKKWKWNNIWKCIYMENIKIKNIKN